MVTIVDFLNALSRPHVYKPLITAMIIGIVCSLIGIFMVLRKLVFLGNGIAHSAFAGGALGILLGINPFITIGIFAILSAVGIGYVREKTELSNETAIGILFSLTMAMGIIFIGLFKTYNTAISSLLFGSLASISTDEVIVISVFGTIVLVTLFFVRKELYFTTFDEELAKANGIPTSLLNYIFLLLVALNVVMCITTVGVILVMAFVVTPAAIANQFTYKLNNMIFLSIIISSLGTFFGYMIAFILDISGSASIVVLLTIMFGISMAISPKRRGKKSDVDDTLCNICERVVEGVECRYCVIDESNVCVDENGHDHEIHERKNPKEDGRAQ